MPPLPCLAAGRRRICYCPPPFDPQERAVAYDLTKTFHLVFVIAWMAAVFYLPRILVNLAEAGDVAPVRERLLLMGRRLYRFGHVMFGIAFVFGLALWMHFGMAGGWLHAKLALVGVLLAYFIVSGRWLKGVAAGRALPSATTLRWFNELPVLLLVAVVYLVIAKPF
jgi:putative membrane protein